LLKLTPEGELDTSFGQDGALALPLILPILAGAIPQAGSRLVAQGDTAWLTDEFVFAEGNRGLLIRFDLMEL
jgi:hypothetical protein